MDSFQQNASANLPEQVIISFVSEE